MELQRSVPPEELTRAEQKILDFINTNTDSFLFLTIGQLAQRLDLSDATVSRFARHAGCRDFKALKARVLEQATGPAVKMAGTLRQEASFSPAAWLEQLKDYLDGNFAYIDEYLKKYLPKAHLVKAEGTYLAWIDLNGYVDRDEKKLEELMQKKAKVALDEGYIFGDEGRGFERINVASPRSVIEECMNRIRTAFEEEKLV